MGFGAFVGFGVGVAVGVGVNVGVWTGVGVSVGTGVGVSVGTGVGVSVGTGVLVGALVGVAEFSVVELVELVGATEDSVSEGVVSVFFRHPRQATNDKMIASVTTADTTIQIRFLGDIDINVHPLKIK